MNGARTVPNLGEGAAVGQDLEAVGQHLAVAGAADGEVLQLGPAVPRASMLSERVSVQRTGRPTSLARRPRRSSSG